ncbi:MAG: C-terminal binding protein [Enterocloster citroniae]|nr:C-terminal binding protein [Enterocloster citroniae]
MGNYKIVISDYQYDTIEPQREVVRGYEDAQLFGFQCKTEQEVLDAAADADIIINQYAPMTERVINGLKCCRAIIRYGIGVDTIDIKAATAKGIYVCNVPDYGVDETSNHAISMILALARKLPVIMADVKKGNWRLECAKPLHRFAGSTLGLVGLGRIATAVARKMAAFDLDIIAYDPYVDEERGAGAGVRLVDFDTLCRSSDYISIHCPSTDENYHLMGREAFRQMKPTAYLINAARGSIVDEEALVYALEHGEIAGAGLDVLEKEPIDVNSRLLQMDQVIVTSHFGGYSEEAIFSLQRKAALEAVNILSGNPPYHAVNGELIGIKS